MEALLHLLPFAMLTCKSLLLIIMGGMTFVSSKMVMTSSRPSWSPSTLRVAHCTVHLHVCHDIKRHPFNQQ